MPAWPANLVEDWNTKMRAFLAIGHDLATGLHSEPGMVRQIVNSQESALDTGTTLMETTDNIPQITGGDEYLTVAITPKSAANKLLIEVNCNFGHSVSDVAFVMALFQDTTVNALAASMTHIRDIGDRSTNFSLRHFMTAGTTSSTTFRVRAGGSTGATTSFNGQSGVRKLGGVMASSITITEIQV